MLKTLLQPYWHAGGRWSIAELGYYHKNWFELKAFWLYSVATNFIIYTSGSQFSSGKEFAL